MKVAERAAARALRRDGWSVKRIAAHLGVAASSVSRWVADVPLTVEQEAALRRADPVRGGRARGSAVRAERARARRLEAQAAGRRQVRAGDPLDLLGCALYWAEGAKSRNQVCFVNSDPEMLRVFVRFLRERHGVADEAITVTVHCHLGNGLALADIEAHWLRVLGLPAACLRRAWVAPPSADAQRRGKLPYGTVRIRVSSTEVAQRIFGGIQELAGFERPAWAA